VVNRPAPVRILVASSNPGKLREYLELAEGSGIAIETIPNFPELPAFDESAPTFAENAAGKVLHYSRFTDDMVLADDSGLVVPALGGAPGVRSARYAGPEATDADRIRKLLSEMKGKQGAERSARFICVTAIAKGRPVAIVSDFVEGLLAEEPRGGNGFGYDPVFVPTGSGRSFAEISAEEKNLLSHRGRSFRKILQFLLESGNPRL
jgi:XTP/dITP diphosphohydrolase